MIARRRHLQAVKRLLSRFRVVGIIGARQVGKTTLARQLLATRGASGTRFDLEDERDLSRLADPLLALSPLKGLVVLDEVQRRPELFPALRVLADTPRGPRFLVLGSASPDLLQQSSESLAGRIAYYELPGFSLDEVGMARGTRLWLRGGFPRSFDARSEDESRTWRREFVRTFLERDLPQLGITVPGTALSRFWSMLAHYHGQTWNSSEFARSFGVADTTVNRYLDLLVSTFMVRRLAPWHENLAKRQVKAPKVYIADTGILHTLLGVEDVQHLERHPKVGASWEGFCIRALAQHLGARADECFFWATHGGAELDLLVVRGRQRRGFEIKRTTAPGVTPSVRIALQDLKLDSIQIIHAGNDTFPLAKSVRAVAFKRLLKDVKPLT